VSDDEEPLRVILARIEGKIDQLSGLPGTVERLTNELLEMRSATAELTQTVKFHSEQVNAHRIRLRDVAPLLDRFQNVVDHSLPEFISKLETLTGNHESMKSEIERVERESQRVSGDRA
jgi:archaellum component FlaC